MKWYYQGIGGVPFYSRTAAREVRDISLKTIEQIRKAIEKHSPLPGYVRSLHIVGSSYTRARQYLEERNRG